MTTLIPKYDLKDGGATPTGAINRPINEKLAEWISIKDFGAQCDGVTDDTAAVQAAINYCATFDQWPALLIPGQTLLTASINIDRPVDTETSEFQIIGEGPGAGFVVSTAITMFDSTLTVTTDPKSELIAFIGIQFESTNSALNAYVISQKFLRIRFSGCFFQAVKCITATIYTQDFRFTDCKAVNWTNIFFGSHGAYAIHVINTVFEFGGAGFYLPNPTGANGIAGCSFVNNLYENCSGTFFTGTAISGLNIVGNYFEANTLPVLSLDYSNSYPNVGVNFSGNYIISTATNQANASFFEVNWGVTRGCFSSGNYCLSRLHNVANTYLNGLQIQGDYAQLVLVKGQGTSLLDPTGTSINGVVTGVDKNQYLYIQSNVAWTALDPILGGVARGPGEVQNGNYVPIRLIFGQSNPAIDNTYYGNVYWTKGSRILNSIPSVGQPKGWICTVSGLPGTWVSEGNL